MFKYLIPAVAVLMLAVQPAQAGSCPKIMKAFDEAVGKSTASADMKTKAAALRAEGEAMHKAGKHAESVKALNEAMKLIGAK